jgi:hypothetical protein
MATEISRQRIRLTISDLILETDFEIPDWNLKAVPSSSSVPKLIRVE